MTLADHLRALAVQARESAAARGRLAGDLANGRRWEPFCSAGATARQAAHDARAALALEGAADRLDLLESAALFARAAMERPANWGYSYAEQRLVRALKRLDAAPEEGATQ